MISETINSSTKIIKVFYFAPENSGVAMYRFYQPLKELEEQGLIELKSWGFDFTNKQGELPDAGLVKKISDWADICIFGRLDVPQYFNIIKMIKEFGGKKVILDIDDNIFSITPYLPAYQAYNPNGPTMKLHEEIAKYVDAIVVSTNRLAEIYEKFNKNIRVIPNGIKYVLQKNRHEGINIGYMCSAGHLENAQIVEGQIMKVLRKYPQARFYYTKAFAGFMEHVPQDIATRINYLPFFPLKDYLKYVNNLGLDIGIAPLMKNDFNDCKSNIRILEYWQNQTSVVASPAREYAKTIQHGYNGYLAENDEWDHWIGDLIESESRRNYLIQNSLRSLKQYDIKYSAEKYLQFLRELV